MRKLALPLSIALGLIACDGTPIGSTSTDTGQNPNHHSGALSAIPPSDCEDESFSEEWKLSTQLVDPDLSFSPDAASEEVRSQKIAAFQNAVLTHVKNATGDLSVNYEDIAAGCYGGGITGTREPGEPQLYIGNFYPSEVVTLQYKTEDGPVLFQTTSTAISIQGAPFAGLEHRTQLQDNSGVETHIVDTGGVVFINGYPYPLGAELNATYAFIENAHTSVSELVDSL